MPIPLNPRKALLSTPIYTAPVDATRVANRVRMQPEKDYTRTVKHTNSPKKVVRLGLVGNVSPSANSFLKGVRTKTKARVAKAVGKKLPRDTWTNDQFPAQFLNKVDSINLSQLDKQVPDWRDRVAKGDTVTIAVNGKDYTPSNYGHVDDGAPFLDRLYRNPLNVIEATLGSYTVKADRNGITTLDTYDFDPVVAKNPLEYLTKGNNYGVFRSLGNIFGPREDDPIWMRPLINLRSNFPTVWR